MKKDSFTLFRKVATVALVLIGLVFAGCEKEEMLEEEYIITKNYSNYKFQNYQLPKTIIENDIEEFNNILALELSSFVLNDDFTRFVIKECRKDNKGLVCFDDVFDKFPELLKIINFEMKNNDVLKNYDFSSFSLYLKKNEDYYIPVICIPNLEYIDENIVPIVSPGIEIEDVNDNFIWAYYMNNKCNTIKLNEKDAIESKCPLFVVSFNSPQDLKYIKNDVENLSFLEENISESKVVVKSLKAVKLKINDRYEDSGKSQVCIKMIAYSPNGTLTNVIFPDYKTIAKIDKDDIGDLVDIEDVLLFNSYSNWTGEEEYFFNLYERDWYASKKLILYGYSFYAGSYIYLYGRMNNSWNWYLYSPSSTNYGEYFSGLLNGENSFVSDKCELVVNKQ